MQIKESILEKIRKSVEGLTYETGGILGSSNGIITAVVMDKPNNGEKRACSYELDVSFFNAQIEKWMFEGIEFEGIFHTHFANVRTLSCADKKYILQIMNAMPKSVDRLYFPVYTLPEEKLTVYSAEKTADGIAVQTEIIDIVK